MAASTTKFVTSLNAAEASCLPSISVSRSAFYLQRHGQPVFAWLHQHSEQHSFDHGVIICPPIGYEQLHAHRSLRCMADQLATERVPTLRFDWHGTGDSPGIDEDPDRLATWLANIGDAVSWMRHELGCRQISLVGLRLGATLATLAAADHDISHLILWAPVTKGRSFVRELTALGRTSDAPVRPTSVPSADIEAGGFTLSGETAQALTGIDLFKIQPRCQRVCLVGRSEVPDDLRLGESWAAAGVQVQPFLSPEYSDMMLAPHRSIVPGNTIHEITTWITNAVSTQSLNIITKDPPAQSSTISLPNHASPSTLAEIDGWVRESTFEISTKPQLFGIVTEPMAAIDQDRPVVVLLNAGASYRIGASRLNVLAARQFAANGFRCVRVDLNGLGDSIDNDGRDHNDSYCETMFRDIESALTQIERKFAAKRIILMGLCSGAYAAFQAATQIKSTLLVESILINPLTFFWTRGMTLETSSTKQLMSFHYYSEMATNPKNWLKLLTGRSKTGLVGALKVLARQLTPFKGRSSSIAEQQSDLTHERQVTHPVRDDLPGDLKRVEQANRQLAMFFSASDPGFSILNSRAKRKAAELRRSGRLNVGFVNDADHTFTRRDARTELLNAIGSHLHRRYN